MMSLLLNSHMNNNKIQFFLSPSNIMNCSICNMRKSKCMENKDKSCKNLSKGYNKVKHHIIKKNAK